MVARPTLTKLEKPATDKPKGQARPVEERFMLRVDGQIKRSFSGKEPAMRAGSVIKKAFPIVVVKIEDTKDGTVEIGRNPAGPYAGYEWDLRRYPPPELPGIAR